MNDAIRRATVPQPHCTTGITVCVGWGWGLTLQQDVIYSQIHLLGHQGSSRVVRVQLVHIRFVFQSLVATFCPASFLNTLILHCRREIGSAPDPLACRTERSAQTEEKEVEEEEGEVQEVDMEVVVEEENKEEMENVQEVEMEVAEEEQVVVEEEEEVEEAGEEEEEEVQEIG